MRRTIGTHVCRPPTGRVWEIHSSAIASSRHKINFHVRWTSPRDPGLYETNIFQAEFNPPRTELPSKHKRLTHTIKKQIIILQNCAQLRRLVTLKTFNFLKNRNCWVMMEFCSFLHIQLRPCTTINLYANPWTPHTRPFSTFLACQPHKFR